MSDTIRDIINNIRGDDYGPMNYENYEEAEQAIKAYVLGAVMELIGADDEKMPISDASMSYQNGQNDLRQELRDKANKKWGK